MDRKNKIIKKDQWVEWTYLDIVYINAYHDMNPEQMALKTLIEVEPIHDNGNEVNFEDTTEKLINQFQTKYGIQLEYVHELTYDFGLLRDIYKDIQTDEYYGLFISDGQETTKTAIIEKVYIVDWNYIIKNRQREDWDDYLRINIKADPEDFFDWYENYIK